MDRVMSALAAMALLSVLGPASVAGAGTGAVAVAEPTGGMVRGDPAAVVSVREGETIVEIAGTPDPQRLLEAAGTSALPGLLRETSFALAGSPDAMAGGLHAVGDLDGDGQADLIQVEQSDQAPVQASALHSVRYIARRGSDRAELWSLEEQGQLGSPLPVDTGDDGLVLATLAVTSAELLARVELHLVGVAADGTERWTHSFAGTVSSIGPVFDGFPLIRLPVDLSSGRQAVLVALVDWVNGGGWPYPSPGAGEAVLIDALTGEIVGRPSTSGEGLVLPSPAGDLDGDGTGDIVFTLAESFASSATGTRGGELHAFSSTGQELWRVADTQAAALGSWVTPVGDTTGDGVPDVGVSNGGSGPAGSVYVFAGDDGRLLVSKSGSYVMALGDIDGDGRADVLARSLGLLHDGDPFYFALNEAFDGTGRTLYREEERISLAHRQSSYGTTVLVYLVGTDLDGDGIPDPRHRGYYHVDGQATDISTAFAGAHGRPLFSGELGVDLGGSISGAGNDLVVVRPTDGNQVVLAGQDGATGQILWEQAVTLDAPVSVNQWGFTTATASVGDLNGDGVGDVVVNIPIIRSPVPMNGVRAVVLSGLDGSGL